SCRGSKKSTKNYQNTSLRCAYCDQNGIVPSAILIYMCDRLEHFPALNTVGNRSSFLSLEKHAREKKKVDIFDKALVKKFFTRFKDSSKVKIYFASVIPSQRSRRGSVVAFETDKWPQGRVPYVLSSAYTTSQRAVLARAIAAYNAKTCIRFVPKAPTDKDYIVISKLDGCYADFARVGGKQQVSLSDECVDYPTVIHELMHVIGFIHEHQRDDRDGYVKIVWENIINGANSDFDKLSSVGLSNYGETYDYFSIMHYENTEGSRNGKSTIEAKIPAFTSLMGKSTDFTHGDLNRINRAYKCRMYT
ncbi:hypothetical protein FO519_006981, partial [Halicephalobus sp. NKZ332]